jgi:hypothetical protein
MSILDKIKSPTKPDTATDPFVYTEEQLMARLKFFIGICLALTLVGIVFVVLYSIIFVTQPLNAISPIDQKFFELIIPIATFLTGTLSGIMLAGNDKDLKAKALDAAAGAVPQARPVSSMPTAASTPGAGGFGSMASPPRPPVPPVAPMGMPPPPPPGMAPVSSAPPGPPNLPPPPVF